MQRLKRPRLGMLGLACLLLLSGVLGLLVGAAPVSIGEVWAVFSGQTPNPVTAIIINSIRLPRVVGAAFTGAALAISGVLFQALLRNPLAEPYLLGVSSGAALGAVMALTVLGGILGPLGTLSFALIGALLAIMLVFWVAVSASRLDTYVLILSGVVVAAFCGAVMMLVLSLAEEDTLRSAVLWTMGSLERASWHGNLILGICVLISGAISFGLARHLNAFSIGEEAAAYLGAEVEKVKRIVYFVASLLAAVTVSTAGVIGFVGLVVPHAIRMLWGGDHRLLIPLAALGGGVSLILADAVARAALSPLELPIGVVTAILGVPFFLVLLRRSYV